MSRFRRAPLDEDPTDVRVFQCQGLIPHIIRCDLERVQSRLSSIEKEESELPL